MPDVPVALSQNPRAESPERPRLSPEEARAAIRAAQVALLDERRQLTADELVALADVPDSSVPALAALAHEVRLEWCGDTVEVEGILSAKTGGCPEDCHFCSQSASFESPVQATPFLDTAEVIAAAKETAALGATEFCIVLAIRGPDERTMNRILELVPIVHEEAGINVAVSAGIITDDQARRLAEGGVHRYNHNLETAESFFPNVVTTHSWAERFETCQLVAEHGMELCCGVLLGMGETHEQRLELVGQLRAVDPAEVPINFLNPRPGTPLRRPPAGRAARGHPLDRPVPPRPPVGDPALRRRPRGHPARAPGPRAHLRHQRPHRGQLPHDARALARRGPPDAGRPPDADGRPVQGVLGVAGPEPAAHCIWCGTALATHPDQPCRRELDPPRFCPTCGRRLRVKVHPAGWEASCRDHGPLPDRPGLSGA